VPLIQLKEASFHVVLTPFTRFYLFQLQKQLGISCLARSEAAQSCGSFGDASDQVQAAEGHAFWFRPSVLLASIVSMGRGKAG